MDCDGTDCDGCAVCDTLTMSTPEGWAPTKLPEGVTGRCTLCRTVGQLDHYTPLGMGVCVPCTERLA